MNIAPPITSQMREDAKTNRQLAFTVDACERFYKSVLPVILVAVDKQQKTIIGLREDLVQLRKDITI